MAVRWGHSTGLRATAASTPALAPSRRQAAVLTVLLVLAIIVSTAVSYLVRPERARSFDLYRGSLFLADSIAPVAVDLASGRPTVRLVQAAKQVGADNTANLSVVPLDHSTLLLNRNTGEFNMVASTGFVVKTDGGVPVTPLPGSTGAVGIASGSLAYIEQTGPTGTSVYLVGQSTIDSAGATRGTVRPRASRSMAEAADTTPGSSAAADGDLWLLLGSGADRTVRRLQLPRHSNPGTVLRSTDHGRVSRVSAVESATTGTGTSAAVGVASPTGIRLFTPHGSARTIGFPRVVGADSVVPVSNAQGRLAYLFHSAGGWSVVSVAADGSDLRGPTRLTGIGADESLAPPAMSNDRLYTIDTKSGQILRIDDSAAWSAVQPYPLTSQHGRIIEPGGYADAYAIARGGRVIVNSPSHLEALVLFTDGSHKATPVAKSSAVSVNAASGPRTLTRSRLAIAHKARRSPTSPRKNPAADPVDNTVDCRTTQQKPHIPAIIGAVPGSRSVMLSWSYPTPDPQDCTPSTYVVGVTLLSDGAPPAPPPVRVQGQTSVNLAQLFPDTEYAVTVTAYLDGVGTSSAPRRITTGPAGPTAPLDVEAATDNAGNWTVHWSSCGTVAQQCVPAASWQVIPEYCDGRGLSGAPAPIEVTADPTTTAQPAVRLAGGDALLGRGVRFQVEGIGSAGAKGDPSSYTSCTYSWSPPQASELTLHASTAAVTSLGASTSATATLDLGSDPVRAAGGVGATFTYTLSVDGRPLMSTGPTPRTTVRFRDIAAATRYQVEAVVAPPRHPAAAVAVGPVALQPATAPWPTIGVSATATDSDATTALLTVDVSGLSSSAASGERFDYVDSELVCGSNTMPLTQAGVDPSEPVTFAGLPRVDYQGSCRVQVRLRQSAAGETDPPLFGDGTTSNLAVSQPFHVDPPDLVGVTDADFAASWDGAAGGQSQIRVSYQGSNPLIVLATDWSVTVTDRDGTSCGGYLASPVLTDVSVDQGCVDADGDSGTGWTASVHFDFLGGTKGPFAASPVLGDQAPTYQPRVCDVADAGLAAGWDGTAAAPSFSVTADHPAQVSACTGWSYTISSPDTPDCGTTPGGAPPTPELPVTCQDDRTAPGWQVTVTYQDLDGGTRDVVLSPIGGTPP